MAPVTASAEAGVGAPADLVLEIIRDFDDHHRHILPPAFSDFVVEEGGVGAGTVASFTTTLAGRAIRGRTIVSEPEPGIVRETVEGGDMVTLFRVTPQGSDSRVEISTTWTPSGVAERLVAPTLLRRIYRQELDLLDHYAREVAASRASAPARVAG